MKPILRKALLSTRPRLLPITLIAVLSLHFIYGRTSILVVPLAIFAHWFVFAINDYYDWDLDRTEPRRTGGVLDTWIPEKSPIVIGLGVSLVTLVVVMPFVQPLVQFATIFCVTVPGVLYSAPPSD